MRLFLAALAVVMVVPAFANQTPVKRQKPVWEGNVFKLTTPQDRIRQCMSNCVATYDRPGPELKRCVAQCQKLK